MIISPCNGLKKCFRHPTGCARFVRTSREDWAASQERKARRERLWKIVLENYRARGKWGMSQIPREYHLNVVLLLEQLLFDEEFSRKIKMRSVS